MTENATIKCGLTMPLSDLFRRNQLQSMEEILLNSKQRMLSHCVIQNHFSLKCKGYSNQNRLFLLILLVLWCEEYGISL